MVITDCLDCGQAIHLTGAWASQLIRCQSCGAELEVINIDPLELDWVYLEPVGIDEDWDWDWRGAKDREEKTVEL